MALRNAFCLVMLLSLIGPRVGMAGIFGVPTNLNSAGQTTSSSVNPPGFFILAGTDSSDGDGDITHQIRLFIEVTGTTLDVRVFDPGISGARDSEGTATSRTTYQLLTPTGTALATVSNMNNDTTVTQNRLARLTSAGFVALSSGTHFTGLQPGLYELRATMTNGGTDKNAFGVDVRVSSTDTTHYNVFTIGKTSDPDTAMVIGAGNSGTTPYANITQRMVFYPYVNRGCGLTTSNFDMDTYSGGAGLGAAGDITDVLEAATALTMGTVTTTHTEDAITVHATSATNLVCNNYGMYVLTNDTGTQQNLLDWRVADFLGWSTNPTNAPRNPTNAVRMYLPNGYFDSDTGIPPNDNATPPVEPTLAVSARVVSGTNPPVSGSTTRFDITAAVENPTAKAVTNVQVTIPIVTGATFVSGTQVGAIDGTTATCTDGSGTGYRRCTFATLAAGSAASLSIQVDFTPTTSSLWNLTGAPAATASSTLSPEGVTSYIPANTTVWALYTPAYSSTTYSRTEYLGPLCNLVVNVGAAGALPTRASIVGLRVNPAGSVEFATGTQVNTVAFNVYGAQDARRTTARVRLNRSLVRTPVTNSMTPILYRVETGAVTAPYLYIEEIDGRGRRHSMGPFAATDPVLLERFLRVEARLTSTGTLERHGARVLSTARRERRGPADARLHRAHHHRRAQEPSGVKIEVDRAGRVRVDLQDLIVQGLPVQAVSDPERLHLSNRGRPVKFQILTEDGSPVAIEFQAESVSTVYTRKNVYVATWDRSARPPAVALTDYKDPRGRGMVRIEQNWLYLANAPVGSDPWFWDMLFWEDPTRSSFSFDLPSPAPENESKVPVRLRLYSAVTYPHQVEAYVNGTSIGTLTIQGSGFFILRGTLPAGALYPSGNELSLISGDAAGEAMDYLDYLDIGLRANTAEERVDPVRMAPYDPGLPHLEGTDYLIVTHPLLEEQAQRIASQKRRDGYRPVVVDVESAYDAFSAGLVEANAIHEVIKRWAQASRGGSQRYVLLVGDDTFDYPGYLDADLVQEGYTPTTVFVPSLLGWDEEFGRVPSENRYADLDGDGSPDVAIGRLPAQTVDQAAILVEKLSRQEQILRGNAGRHLFAADNQGPDDVNFSALATSVSAQFPTGSVITRVSVDPNDPSAARRSLLQALQQGTQTTQYFGHANPEFWADEHLLDLDALDALANTYRETVLFSWACEAQFFQYLYGPSINEALLLVERGGALAAFGPAGVTEPSLQEQLFSRVYDRFFRRNLPLGEAIRRAKAEAIQANPAIRPVVEGWNLLGDPALRLPE